MKQAFSILATAIMFLFVGMGIGSMFADEINAHERSK